MTNNAVSNPSSGFATDFLRLASFLVSRGHDARLSLAGPNKVLFTFNSDVAQDVDAFARKESRIEPGAFDHARIELRRRMDALLERDGV